MVHLTTSPSSTTKLVVENAMYDFFVHFQTSNFGMHINFEHLNARLQPPTFHFAKLHNGRSQAYFRFTRMFCLRAHSNKFATVFKIIRPTTQWLIKRCQHKCMRKFHIFCGIVELAIIRIDNVRIRGGQLKRHLRFKFHASEWRQGETILIGQIIKC